MAYNVMETCMLVNMGLTRSECASWVQAWGSIGAILAASGGVYWAHRLQRKHRQEEQAADFTQFLESVFQLIGGLRGISTKILAALEQQHGTSREDRATMRAELGAFVDAYRRVDITRLGRYDFIEALQVADALARRLDGAIEAVSLPGREKATEEANLRELTMRALETLDERGRRLFQVIETRGGPPGAAPLPANWAPRAPAG